MARRGRSLRGELNERHKLTTEQVVDIKKRLGSKERHQDIASDYGVSRTTITQISLGKIWGWLAPANDNENAGSNVA